MAFVSLRDSVTSLRVVLALALVSAGCADEAAFVPGDDAAPRDEAPSCDDGGPCEGTDPDDAEAPHDDDAGDDAGDDAAEAPPDVAPLDASRADAAIAMDAPRADVNAMDARADVSNLDARLDVSASDVRADAAAADVRADVVADAGVTFLPLPTCATVDRRLREDFGIQIQPGTIPFEGLPSENIDCAGRILVYRMFIAPHQYERFPRRVNVADPYVMHLYRRSGTVGSCSAYTPSGQAIQIRDLRSCLAAVSGPTDPDFARIAMFLIHETGHIITSRTYSLRAAFSSAGLTRLDPSCYDRGFLKTYSLRTTNPVNESFAEATALFIGRRKVGVYGTITNFQTQCPHTYAWIQTTVFGNRR